MNFENVIVEKSRYKPSFTTTTVVLTSLLNVGMATAQFPCDTPVIQPSITYEKELNTSASNSLTSLNAPSDRDIVNGLIDIHENLLSHQEFLDENLQTLLYENIDDLYA